MVLLLHHSHSLSLLLQLPNRLLIRLDPTPFRLDYGFGLACQLFFPVAIARLRPSQEIILCGFDFTDAVVRFFI